MALYQEVLGDALRAQNVPSKAKRAYEAGVYAANAAGQKKIARRLQRKINSLARQFSTPRGGGDTAPYLTCFSVKTLMFSRTRSARATLAFKSSSSGARIRA